MAKLYGTEAAQRIDDHSLHPPRHRPVSRYLLERLYRLTWSDPAALRSAPPRKGAGNGLRHRLSFTKPKYRLNQTETLC